MFFDLNDIKLEKEGLPKDEAKTEVEIEKEVQETRAFENYIRGVVTNERATNLNVGDNGAVIPETILNKIIKKEREGQWRT